MKLPEIQIGDVIVYQRQPDGDWYNLYSEQVVSDEQMQAWFPKQYAEECRCIQPEHICPKCKAEEARIYGDSGWIDRHSYDHVKC